MGHLVYLAGWLILVFLLGFAWYQQLKRNYRPRGRFVLAAVAVAVVVALVVASAGTVALAVELTVAVAVAGTGAFALALAFAVAFVVAFAFAFAVAGIGGLAVAVAGALLVAFGLERYLTRTRAPVIAYFYYLTLWIGLAAGALSLVDTNDAGRSLILFLVILPIINGIFDFLSFGTTRHLIKKGVQARGWPTFFWGLADLLAAVILFTALGCTLVLVITFFNSVSLTPLIDLGGTLRDIADNPHRYWWLYVGTFSTVIPTLIHFGVTGLCFVSWFPQRLRTWIANEIESETNGFANFRGHAALSVLGTTLVVLALAPVVILAIALYNFYPDMGRAYLWMITQLANQFGTSVPKSDIWNCVGCV